MARGLIHTVGYWAERLIMGWEAVERSLQLLGLLAPPEQGFAPLEGVVEQAYRPVSPSDGFRSHLRQNLALAANQREGGLAVERPRPYREALLLSASAAVVAAGIAVAVALSRSHWTSGQREI
jgi:hypothetical protein